MDAPASSSIYNINWFKLTCSFTLSPQMRICAEWYNHRLSAVTIFTVFRAIYTKSKASEKAFSKEDSKETIYQIYSWSVQSEWRRQSNQIIPQRQWAAERGHGMPWPAAALQVSMKSHRFSSLCPSPAIMRSRYRLPTRAASSKAHRPSSHWKILNPSLRQKAASNKWWVFGRGRSIDGIVLICILHCELSAASRSVSHLWIIYLRTCTNNLVSLLIANRIVGGHTIPQQQLQHLKSIMVMGNTNGSQYNLVRNIPFDILCSWEHVEAYTHNTLLLAPPRTLFTCFHGHLLSVVLINWIFVRTGFSV